MSVQNCAIVNSGTITNVIAVDPATFTAPSGEQLVPLGSSGAWIGWGATETGGVWSFTAPEPVLSLQAALAAISGLTITLSGSMTLAATLFPTDVAAQTKLAAVMITIAATGAFPGGLTSFPMKDSSGTWHTFTVAQYTAISKAISSFVATCDLIADGNPLGATALPSNSVSLAV